MGCLCKGTGIFDGEVMPSVVVVGAQWGDEGKGKITDYLAQDADMVVRHQGGSNAGHTVVVQGREYKLHLIPSGILYPDKTCVIGNGVVIDPEVLLGELEYLRQKGVDTSHLRISSRAHIILPYHKMLDGLDEDQKGENRIGTTRRGVGPAYMDKDARIGIRVVDLLDPEEFRTLLSRNLAQKNRLLRRVYDVDGFEEQQILDTYTAYAERLRHFVVDGPAVINEAVARGANVLFEGAQGTLLDIDHGTYPYVTSSHPVAGGACIGAGVGPTRINEVIGVVKAYTSRVGDGPFPTELNDATGEWIRERGHEYGTTTGRPRRCGWMDACIVRYAALVSGLTGLAVTRLDTLGGLPTVKICVGYRMGDEIVRDFPASLKLLERCEPVYEELEGWPADLSGVSAFEQLPAAARKYLSRLEELTGVEIDLLSIGRERAQTLVRREMFSTK